MPNILTTFSHTANMQKPSSTTLQTIFDFTMTPKSKLQINPFLNLFHSRALKQKEKERQKVVHEIGELAAIKNHERKTTLTQYRPHNLL